MEVIFKKDGILKDGFQTVASAETTSNNGSAGGAAPKVCFMSLLILHILRRAELLRDSSKPMLTERQVKKPRAKKAKVTAPEQAENGKLQTPKNKAS